LQRPICFFVKTHTPGVNTDGEEVIDQSINYFMVRLKVDQLPT